jgi:hypothetical protein
MSFFAFLLLAVIAYLIWRISDQLPDILFRLSEIQKAIAEINRRGAVQPTEEKKTCNPSKEKASRRK